MKKLLFILFLVFAGVVVFAWEPQDLTKYPACMKEGTIITNIGIGLYVPGNMDRGSYFPATRFSLDGNIGIGDKKLPFFIGGVASYWGFGSHYHHLSVGGRFGYHFNWGIEKLDTYAVSTAGWIIHFDQGGAPLFGVNVGARYFLNDWFGFWAEGGYSSFSLFDIGIAFKF
ncbi:MAG: hypothetical protein LBV17_01520 [Treponema sp.]|jgi:hypothetical protein|nr:hypothetical protein [Treponema sp.]